MVDEYEVRFWRKVNKDGPVAKDGLGQCWIWTAFIDRDGYGFCGFRWKRNQRPHRIALALSGVNVQPDVLVCHACDNPSCCNPKHLFLGSHVENQADKVAKGRQNKGNVARNGEDHGRNGPKDSARANESRNNVQ